VVGEGVIDGVSGITSGDASANKENVFLESGICRHAIEVGFIERVAARAVPIKSAIGFLYALAIAVIRFIGLE